VTADAIPASLAASCARVRAATPADVVGGQMPRFVAEPASTSEASAVLAAAAGLGLAVLPRGSGTRLAWGAAPRRCDLIVDTRQMDQVLEHAAGDLVARVQAGTRLSQLADRLARAGQRLALDPCGPDFAAAAAAASTSAAGTGTPGTGTPGTGTPGTSAPGTSAPGTSAPGTSAPGTSAPGTSAPGTSAVSTRTTGRTGTAEPGTVGGLVATGAAGPLRFRFGTPRDLLIGITVVLADGTIAKAGGKVVKNVAGYDLGKLFAGSLGTLGLITEATFRLHPRPAAVAYVTVDCPDAASALAVMAAAASSPLAPSAAEIDQPRRGAPISAGILVEGEPAGVAERAERLRDLLAASAPAASAWSAPAGDLDPPASGPAPRISDTGPRVSKDTPAASAWSAPAGDLDPPAGGPAPRISDTGPRVSATAPAWWGRGAAAAADGTVLQIAFWSGQLAAVLESVDLLASETGLDLAISGSAGAGVLHAAIPAAAPPAAVTDFVTRLRGALSQPPAAPGTGGPAIPPTAASVVVLHASAEVMTGLDLWGPVPGLPLMHAIKDQFDPEHRMAPGRYAGGI
jgi:glycolate oxidase FAD binding subunit